MTPTKACTATLSTSQWIASDRRHSLLEVKASRWTESGIEPAPASDASSRAYEVAVPTLKLSSNPLKQPIQEQMSEFVSHLIYGIGTALTYDHLRRLKRRCE
jgi:hypothetical protein